VKQECPMCGESMRLEPIEQVNRIAGTMQTSSRHALEWRCKECDYFEEADGDLDDLSPELRKWMDDKK
jgi:rubredoxin